MRPELKDDIVAALKTLRQADSQAAAVAWMTRAYQLLEACLEDLDDDRRLVFAAERPRLEVVQSIPVGLTARRQKNPFYADQRPENRTVVYPEVIVPVGLKPLPKPWTREDTRRLERAAAVSAKRAIQKRGR